LPKFHLALQKCGGFHPAALGYQPNSAIGQIAQDLAIVIAPVEIGQTARNDDDCIASIATAAVIDRLGIVAKPVAARPFLHFAATD
jgi:hypothetical protein